MDSVQPLMRLKVKADTFFLPDEDGSVYFRNNAGSFRMTGTSIQSWIEKLMPAFDGEHTMADLTDGLPTPYQERIYHLAGILYDNGFVRDTSQDTPHQLPQSVLTAYAPQIEFVDNIVGSGAARFEAYRNADILAVGSGQMLVSLVRSLLESGVSSVHLVMVHEEERIRQQLACVAAASPDGDSPAIDDVTCDVGDAKSLQAVIRRMDAVLYTSETGDTDTLRRLESICGISQTYFCPALSVDGIGIVGPVVRPGGLTASRWDSAWRRMHASLFDDDGASREWSATTGALLANVAVFALFKVMTGIEQTPSDRFYTLDAETLEGVWHDFIPAPDKAGSHPAQISNWQEQVTAGGSPAELADVLSWLTDITHPVSGIFHVWDEGDLRQLPLSQCRVQPVDPQSQGPAELLSERVCVGLSHEDARLEAGLVGIEAYVRRAVAGSGSTDSTDGTDGMESVLSSNAFLGVGAGITAAEAIGRALNQCLAEDLKRALEHHQPDVTLVQLGTVADTACAFYLEALRAAGVEPNIGLSEDRFGLPVVWIEVDGIFTGCAGLSVTYALRQVLSYALLQDAQGDVSATEQARWLVTAPAVAVGREDAPNVLAIPAWSGDTPADVQAAVAAIRTSGQDIRVFDLTLEPFLADVLAGVFGVSICEEGSR